MLFEYSVIRINTFKFSIKKNTRYPDKFRQQFRQQGLTLVEMMVALVIGLLLSAIMIQSYLSTKQTYRLTEGVSRVQENARFATHFLSEHIRRAGNLGCMSYVRTKLNSQSFINFESPIAGWDYVGTDSSVNSYALPLLEEVTSRADFLTSARENIATNDMPNHFFDRIDVLKGSDVLVINSIENSGLVLDAVYPPTATNISTTDDHDFPTRQLIMVGDCFVADLLQVGTATSTNVIQAAQTSSGQPRNNSSADFSPVWSYSWGPDSSIYKVDSAAYYVGVGASGLPSLFRRNFGAGNLSQAVNEVELVEGVETFQVLYGEDTTANGLANKFSSANYVDDWNNIVAVRIGMILRSTERLSEGSLANLELLGHMDITPADADDGILRYAVNTTLKPRNTGNVRTYTVTEASDPVNYQVRVR